MYILKHAVRSICRSKGRSILIGVILFVLALCSCIGLGIQKAADSSRAAMEALTNITATIETDRRGMMEQAQPPEGGQPLEGDREAMREQLQELQSLTLVSEVIYGTPSRFADPARFSFAHGGKDGHPFPVPTQVYDETIALFDDAIHRARLGDRDKADALRNLSQIAARMEENYTPSPFLDDWIARERANAWRWGGRTVAGKEQPPKKSETEEQAATRPCQLSLWE